MTVGRLGVGWEVQTFPKLDGVALLVADPHNAESTTDTDTNIWSYRQI